MTSLTRWPTRCLHGHLPLQRQTPRYSLVTLTLTSTRHYTSKHSFREPSEPTDPVKSARAIVETAAPHSTLNPARSTLPAPLDLPTRGTENRAVYWFRTARAYGNFYKHGVKAVWNNYQASKQLKQRLLSEHGVKDVKEAVAKGVLTRANFQLLGRNRHDIGKLPFFGLLAIVLGEWLVLIVPFIPNTVPETCRIPKQIRRMRTLAETRRRQSFRTGITEPEATSEGYGNAGASSSEVVDWPVAFNPTHVQEMLKPFQTNQLLHLSTSLGLHGSLWDRIQLPPPTSLLRRRIARRLQYLAVDDWLLLRDGGSSAASKLSDDEVEIACVARGMDVQELKSNRLRTHLTWWLQKQQTDSGRGRAMVTMLFRRLVVDGGSQVRNEHEC